MNYYGLHHLRAGNGRLERMTFEVGDRVALRRGFFALIGPRRHMRGTIIDITPTRATVRWDALELVSGKIQESHDTDIPAANLILMSRGR